MVLVIETTDIEAIRALSEVAKALKVTFRVEQSLATGQSTAKKRKSARSNSGAVSYAELEEALRVVKEGCEMTEYGDAKNYQTEIRKDRTLPFRD